MRLFDWIGDKICNMFFGEQRGKRIIYSNPGCEYHLEPGIIVRGDYELGWVYFDEIEVFYGPAGIDVGDGTLLPDG